MINRPGLPTDLPAPEILWARWAAVAVALATTEAEGRYGRAGIWIDEDGLHWDDCGCTWWILTRCGPGRFVLYGEDESSDVKTHRPPIDMLAGAPAWLPYRELRDRLEGFELGCVYWTENGTWTRVPYPDDLSDDGLDCGISQFVDRDEALGLAIDTLPLNTTETLFAHAESYRLTPDLLQRTITDSGIEADLPAMLRALHRAGLNIPA